MAERPVRRRRHDSLREQPAGRRETGLVQDRPYAGGGARRDRQGTAGGSAGDRGGQPVRLQGRDLHTAIGADGDRRLLRAGRPPHLPDPQLRQRLRRRGDMDGHDRHRQRLLDRPVVSGERMPADDRLQRRERLRLQDVRRGGDGFHDAAGAGTLARHPPAGPLLSDDVSRRHHHLQQQGPDRPRRLHGARDDEPEDDHRRRPHVDPGVRPDAEHRRSQSLPRHRRQPRADVRAGGEGGTPRTHAHARPTSADRPRRRHDWRDDAAAGGIDR